MTQETTLRVSPETLNSARFGEVFHRTSFESDDAEVVARVKRRFRLLAFNEAGFTGQWLVVEAVATLDEPPDADGSRPATYRNASILASHFPIERPSERLVKACDPTALG